VLFENATEAPLEEDASELAVFNAPADEGTAPRTIAMQYKLPPLMYPASLVSVTVIFIEVAAIPIRAIWEIVGTTLGRLVGTDVTLCSNM
jgi:hypothetical protein